MIPRSLPATGTGGANCPAARPAMSECQAPKFVPTNALAIQFSFYGPMDTPGFLTPSPVGSYNLVIDDVAFYKRSALPSGMIGSSRAADRHGVMQRQRVPAQPRPRATAASRPRARTAGCWPWPTPTGRPSSCAPTAATIASCARRWRPGAARTRSPKVSRTHAHLRVHERQGVLRRLLDLLEGALRRRLGRHLPDDLAHRRRGRHRLGDRRRRGRRVRVADRRQDVGRVVLRLRRSR